MPSCDSFDVRERGESCESRVSRVECCEGLRGRGGEEWVREKFFEDCTGVFDSFWREKSEANLEESERRDVGREGGVLDEGRGWSVYQW